MIGKRTPESLISAEEAVRITIKESTLSDLLKGRKITDEWRKQKGPITHVYEIDWMLSAIYIAGRIQGIREERAKKKAKKD